MIDEREVVRHAVERLTPPEPSFERLQRRRDRKRRNQRVAAGVVGIAVFVAMVAIVATGGRFDRGATPAATGATVAPANVGFIGLPPEGATPSTPKHGELVLSFEGRSMAADESMHRVYVYADGRVISWWESGSPLGSNAGTFLEQRLTPEGVELLRGELTSTGLFDADQSLVNTHGPEWFWGTIEVLNGDRLVSVFWASSASRMGHERTIATWEQARALQHADARLTNPELWLPADTWEDQELRAYVPSSYAVCYAGRDSKPIAPSQILPQLPPSAAELLSGQRIERLPDRYCADLTTEDARSLVLALDAANAQREELETTFLLYSFHQPGMSAANEIYLSLEPRLPHGEAVCTGCG